MYSAISKQEETIIRDGFAPSDPRMRKFSDMVLMNLEAADSVYSSDNEVEIFTDGREKFSGSLQRDAEGKGIYSYSVLYYPQRRAVGAF